jgi:hypothetical protein
VTLTKTKLKENVDDSRIEPYIVDFGNIYSLPCSYIKSTVLRDPRNSDRIRLLPEFRVDLQAKFFAFLARGPYLKEANRSKWKLTRRYTQD